MPNDSGADDAKRAERLARAKAFLGAGRGSAASAPGLRENAPRKDPAGRKSADKRPDLDPTRYGDWEKNGRCIDF